MIFHFIYSITLTFSRYIDQNVTACMLKRYAAAQLLIYFMNFDIYLIASHVRHVKTTNGSFIIDWSIDVQQVTQMASGVFLEEITAH